MLLDREYRLDSTGMSCAVPAGCGSEGTTGFGELITLSFTQANPPLPVVYVASTTQPSQPNLPNSDGYGNACDADYSQDGILCGPAFTCFAPGFNDGLLGASGGPGPSGLFCVTPAGTPNEGDYP